MYNNIKNLILLLICILFVFIMKPIKRVDETFLDKIVKKGSDAGSDAASDYVVKPVTDNFVKPVTDTAQEITNLQNSVNNNVSDVSNTQSEVIGFSENDLILSSASANSYLSGGGGGVSSGGEGVSSGGGGGVSSGGESIPKLNSDYQDNISKLKQLKESYGLTQKQNADLNTSQNALILNNVTLGIGIFVMMLIVYNK